MRTTVQSSPASTSTAGGNLGEAVPGVNRVFARETALAFAAIKEGSGSSDVVWKRVK